MIYTSEKTEQGNVGRSNISQKAANVRAKAMDANGCTYCTDCIDCTDCHHCTDCTYCIDCTDCHHCTDCTDCTHCTDCTNCTYCTYCTHCIDCCNCNNCIDCTDCHHCTYCTNCTDCHHCTYCTNCHHCHRCSNLTASMGILKWEGPKASHVLVINGLRWPIATDGESVQIGCQHHSVESWLGFKEGSIYEMDADAVGFSKEYKDVILALVKIRKEM